MHRHQCTSIRPTARARLECVVWRIVNASASRIPLSVRPFVHNFFERSIRRSPFIDRNTHPGLSGSLSLTMVCHACGVPIDSLRAPLLAGQGEKQKYGVKAASEHLSSEAGHALAFRTTRQFSLDCEKLLQSVVLFL